MALTPVTIEYLLTDESFIRSCLGRDPGAFEYWTSYEQAHPEYREVLEEARRHVRGMYAWGLGEDEKTQWDQLQGVIHDAGQRIPQKAAASSLKRIKVWGIAASVAGLAVFSSLYLLRGKPQPRSVSYTLISRNGVVRKCALPDGSTVWLDAGSAIRLGQDFMDNRSIELLEGQIFCTVKHDAVHPFAVHTPGGLTIKDVGTAFNVESYKGLSAEVIRVMSGEVAVQKGDSTMELVKEKQGVSVSNGKLTMVDNPGSADASWVDGRIELSDVSFQELAIVLEKTYSIHIGFEKPDLMKCRASTTFNRTAPVRDVLEALKLIYGITYTMQDGKVILHGSGHL